MNESRLSAPSTIGIAAICTLLCVAFGLRLKPKETDFLNLYTGASLALDGRWRDMYKPEVQFARERAFFHSLPHVAYFVRPPAYALAIAPLALLSFEAAFWVWIVTQWALLFSCWAWAWRRFEPEAAAWGALSFSAPLGVCCGQDSTVYLALCIGALLLAERHHAFSSGAVLGLAAVKFHLILIWPLVLVTQKRWRMLLGMSITAAAGAAVSAILLGPKGIRQYIALLAEVRDYYSPTLDMDIWGILNNFRLATWPTLAFSIVIIACVVVRAASRPIPLWMTFAIGIAASLVVSPRAYNYDAAMLLLPIWCVMFLSSKRWLKIVAATLSSPIPFLSGLAPEPFTAFRAICLLLFVLFLCLEQPIYRPLGYLGASVDSKDSPTHCP
jgi:hypothetical protein